MACSICGAIPSYVSANTGRDQHFEAPITSLKALGIGTSGRDLWECPECNAFFHWEDVSSQSGSGNNDEETLGRLSSEHASLVHDFLRRGERPVDDVSARAPMLLDVGDDVRSMVLSEIVKNDPALAKRLVPWLVDLAIVGEHRWAKDYVETIASRIDAKLVDAELAGRSASAVVVEMRAHCKRVSCTICPVVPKHSTLVVRRDAPTSPFDTFLRFDATDELDVWECPGCQLMFLWTQTEGDEGRLSRLPTYSSGPLHACLHRTGPVASYDREMVVASDKHRSLKIVLGHALKRDRELVHEFVPRMVMELSRTWKGPDWMTDFLVAFVEGHPEDAERVVAEIDKAPRSTEQTSTIAAVCRPATSEPPESRR